MARSREVLLGLACAVSAPPACTRRVERASSLARRPVARALPRRLQKRLGDPGEVTAIAVQGASVYWTEPAIGVIATAPVDGGEAIALVSDPSFYPWAIALDSGNLYWSDQKANGVFQLPLTGGKATRIATAPGGAGPIALNATGIYFMTGGPDCAVIRAALDGSG